MADPHVDIRIRAVRGRGWAPAVVRRVRTAGFVPALAPGWFWVCRVCPPTAYVATPTEPTREAAHARLAVHQLAEHQDMVIATLTARAKTGTEAA